MQTICFIQAHNVLDLASVHAHTRTCTRSCMHMHMYMQIALVGRYSEYSEYFFLKHLIICIVCIHSPFVSALHSLVAYAMVDIFRSTSYVSVLFTTVIYVAVIVVLTLYCECVYHPT